MYHLELTIKTERYQRDGLFGMTGISTYRTEVFILDENKCEMELTEHIYLKEIILDSDYHPAGVRLFCDEEYYGGSGERIERNLLYDSELYISNVSFYIDYHYGLKLKRLYVCDE